MLMFNAAIMLIFNAGQQLHAAGLLDATRTPDLPDAPHHVAVRAWTYAGKGEQQ